MKIEDKMTFLDMSAALSPENLHCDGEISRAAAMRKKREIEKRWKALEGKVGRRVREDETWAWLPEIRAEEARRTAALVAAAGSHPLLESNNPGVWSRKGQNGQSAYYIQNANKRGPAFINGINLRADSNDEYVLYSELSRYINVEPGRRFGPEELGRFATLDAAVEHAETFLKTVTFERFKSAQPEYRDENIHRELLRLPA